MEEAFSVIAPSYSLMICCCFDTFLWGAAAALIGLEKKRTSVHAGRCWSAKFFVHCYRSKFVIMMDLHRPQSIFSVPSAHQIVLIKGVEVGAGRVAFCASLRTPLSSIRPVSVLSPNSAPLKPKESSAFFFSFRLRLFSDVVTVGSRDQYG